MQFKKGRVILTRPFLFLSHSLHKLAFTDKTIDRKLEPVKTMDIKIKLLTACFILY